MAIYFLSMKVFGRNGGSGAVSAAAYRSGERIYDERSGRTYDHSVRQDVMNKEIVLPSEFDDQEVPWARDRASLWNTAEGAEGRKSARVAREYLVALPVELTPRQRLSLVREFSQELSDRYNFALDFAIHAPRDFPDSDPRNFHAHLLIQFAQNCDGCGRSERRVSLGQRFQILRLRFLDFGNGVQHFLAHGLDVGAHFVQLRALGLKLRGELVEVGFAHVQFRPLGLQFGGKLVDFVAVEAPQFRRRRQFRGRAGDRAPVGGPPGGYRGIPRRRARLPGETERPLDRRARTVLTESAYSAENTGLMPREKRPARVNDWGST